MDNTPYMGTCQVTAQILTPQVEDTTLFQLNNTRNTFADRIGKLSADFTGLFVGFGTIFGIQPVLQKLSFPHLSPDLQ